MNRTMKPQEIGTGHVYIKSGRAWDLILPPTALGYSDAQIDDYHTLKRDQFPRSPPLRMTLRARVSSPSPPGTFGFGFWNDPFAFSLGLRGARRRFPVSPRCVWFFSGAPPHDLALVENVDGWGWKAQVIQSPWVPGWVLAPSAASALLLAQAKLLRRLIVRAGRRMATVAESTMAESPTDWHRYSIEWRTTGVKFHVDQKLTLQTPIAPKAPLGFVSWIDNQYAVFSPHKGIGFGVLPTQKQAKLEITDLHIEPTGE